MACAHRARVGLVVSLIQAEQLLLNDGRLVPGWVRIRANAVVEVGQGPAPAHADLHVPLLSPGFVDMHCHGGGGAAFGSPDADDVSVAASVHLLHGTTTVIASLVTAAEEDLHQQVTRLAGLAARGVVAGIHLEGPWLSPLHAGAHDPGHLRTPDPGEIAALVRAADGHLRMVTLAPELDGGTDAVVQLARAGVAVAVGHTDADGPQLRAAVDSGASVVTHLCNAMRPIHHRDPGPVVEALADPRLTVEVIVDDLHVHPDVVNLVQRSARSQVALVTDAMAAAGAGDGSYTLGGLAVEVRHGAARLVEGGSIAGSTLTMDRAVRTAVRAGWTTAAALTAATRTPARALGLSAGTIQAGRPADLVALDEGLNVLFVMRGGDFLS
ncbi:N-acetylglucosamine-6-phosphate deacetylase [Ornithinimicrobium sp. W1665]